MSFYDLMRYPSLPVDAAARETITVLNLEVSTIQTFHHVCSSSRNLFKVSINIQMLIIIISQINWPLIRTCLRNTLHKNLMKVLCYFFYYIPWKYYFTVYTISTSRINTFTLPHFVFTMTTLSQDLIRN